MPYVSGSKRGAPREGDARDLGVTHVHGPPVIIGDGLTGRLRDDAFKGLADKALIRNTLTSRAGFHGLK
jgi:hypothetical protein